MVRALLDGTKTQTRRIVKHQPLTDDVRGPMMYHPVTTNRRGEEVEGKPVFGIYDSSGEWGVRCPYGQPGDQLWVRETWAPHPLGRGFIYRADSPNYTFCSNPGRGWKPSIFCKREASRISLEITGVRGERLNAISEEDAWAEGVSVKDHNCGRVGYKALWESINGPGGWDANPWVWCLNFNLIKP